MLESQAAGRFIESLRRHLDRVLMPVRVLAGDDAGPQRHAYDIRILFATGQDQSES